MDDCGDLAEVRRAERAGLRHVELSCFECGSRLLAELSQPPHPGVAGAVMALAVCDPCRGVIEDPALGLASRSDEDMLRLSASLAESGPRPGLQRGKVLFMTAA